MTTAVQVGARKAPTDPAEWGGKLNIYVCDACRGHVVTRDVDEGVTPYLIPSISYCPTESCRKALGKTRSMMSSSFYRVWNQSMRETHQWYRPDAAEIAKLSAYQRAHVDKGGLLLREAPAT